jgi:hypothetical protein
MVRMVLAVAGTALLAYRQSVLTPLRYSSSIALYRERGI